jgi:hypothetical protein
VSITSTVFSWLYISFVPSSEIERFWRVPQNNAFAQYDLLFHRVQGMQNLTGKADVRSVASFLGPRYGFHRSTICEAHTNPNYENVNWFPCKK